ncbi:hypothetical protein ACOMHN_046025 [Nucella lapillus]
MSLAVNPSNSAPSQPLTASLPQMQRIVQDVVDCVCQLKEDFTSSSSPITDDSQVLQRFCVRLEYLLQFEMKERFTLLGKRKDYWDYFCDCLASNKGANDGLRYVKGLGESKTSLGRGRAFIRFSLVHQRLADTLQQCCIHPKTADWYNLGGVWMKPDIYSSIISTLYDLNNLHFDLPPRGYDLDSAWPTFARNMPPGSGNWNVPISRRSSITSMDTLSLVSTDPSELNRLHQELVSAETARSALVENVATLEQERQRAEQSVWMTQGELSAMQEQLRTTGKKLEELQQKYSALELSHSQLQAEKNYHAKEAEKQTAELSVQQHQLSQEKEKLAQQEATLTHQLEKERARFATEIQTMRQNLIETTDARDKLSSKVTSLEEASEQMRLWDSKKDQQISRLEQQTASLEQRNAELMDEMTKNLSSREQDAASQLDSAQKFQEFLSKQKDVEADNVKLQGAIIDLKHKCDVSEKAAEDERAKNEDLRSKLVAETEKCESLSSELKTVRTDVEKEGVLRTEAVKELHAQFTQVRDESDKTKSELISATETLAKANSRQSDLTRFISQLMRVASDSSGASVEAPDISSCSESEVTQFVQTCLQSSWERYSDLETRLEAAEKTKATLTGERDTVQCTLEAIFNALPDKQSDGISREVTQQAQEVKTRVKSLCTQLSDSTTNNSFLKEQLQLAQGEQSDKGNQLCLLEGRLLELEKALKESRATECSLQGQAASMELTLKTSQQENADLQSKLQAATADVGTKAQALQDLEREKKSLEKQIKDLEKQAAELASSVAAALEQVEERKAKEEDSNRKVEEMESALEVAQREIEEKTNQLTSMQDKVGEGEETVEKFLASMASLETDKASIVTEHDNLQQQLTDLTSQLDSAIAEKQQQQSDNETLQQKITQLSEQHAALKKDFESKDSEVASLKETLQTNAQKHSDAEDDLNNQLKSVQAELNQVREEACETQDRLKEATSLKESAQTERDATQQKLEKASSELQEKEVSFSEQLQSLRIQLDTFQTEKEELRKSSSSSHEELTKLLTDKQNVISSLEQEKVDLEKGIKASSEKKQSLEAETTRLQGELEEAKKAAESEKTRLLEESKEKQTKLQSDMDTLKQHNSDMSSELERVKNDLNSKLGEIQETRLKLETTRNEADRLRSNSACEKSELEDNLEKLQSRFSKIQTSMDAILKEKEELATIQATSQEEIMELKSDLASSADGYNFLLQSSQKVQEEKDSEVETLRSQLEQAKQDLTSEVETLKSQLELTKQDLTSELDSSSSQKQSAEEKVVSLESECEALKNKEQELERVLAEKNKEVSDLADLVKSLNSSIAVLEEDDRSQREDNTQLEGRLEERERVYGTQVESLEQEVSALQFQLSSEQLQHEESLKAMGDREISATEMSGRLEEQESMITDLERELSSLQANFETERTNQNLQLEELKGLLKGKEKECRSLAEQLQKTSDKLEETVTSVQCYQKENSSLRVSLDRDVEEREEEIRILRSDNEQLKKKLVKTLRDKAALWQQTDELAYEHKRKSEGKWLDSSTVTKCMGCQADFSLFLRKHHCRLCGGIFCYNCSDHWVDSTSSSRKARACAECFKSLQKLDASVSKPSLLPDDSDDDVSDVGSTSATSQLGSQGSQADSQSQTSLLRETTPEASTTADNANDHSSDFGEDVYASRTDESPEPPDLTSTPLASPAPCHGDSAGVSESASQDSMFQVITQEEVSKSIAAYDDGSAGPQSLIDVPNMSSSMLLTAEDLASGEINTQSETWIKPGRSFAVPISIAHPNTVVTWEFTVQPKDIEFSITYCADSQQPVSQAEVIVSPARCNSIKEPIRGELTAKQAGVYTLVFDNFYSRMTSKKIHYTLSYNS